MLSEKPDNDGEKIIIIEGVRENGTMFRPSDWMERLSSSFAEFGKDHRLRYNRGVRPRIYQGNKVLAVDTSRPNLNPDMLQLVFLFAIENQLRMSATNEI